MPIRFFVAVMCLAGMAQLLAQPNPGVTIRAGRLIDGRGGVANDVTIAIKDGKIASAANAGGAVTYDLSNLTLLPGFIDTHVHIGWHFDATGRYHAGAEPPEQA